MGGEFKWDVLCIGAGREGDGCGQKGGSSGGTCPKCGGMMLGPQAIKQAEDLQKRWLHEHERKYGTREERQAANARAGLGPEETP